MNDTTFYIPINSVNLSHYFNRASILPAKYYSNRGEDVQNRLDGAIVLSNKKWVKDTDCTIEVVLTESEGKNTFNISANFRKYENPIPISRIKTIYFQSANQKNTTLWNINSGAAFIPDTITLVEELFEQELISAEEIDKNVSGDNHNDLTQKLNSYDRFLGGFAFMRLGISANEMNYPENYFSTLSHFNKLIDKQLKEGLYSKGFQTPDKFNGIFLSKGNGLWSKLQRYISKVVETRDVEEFAIEEHQKLEKKLGLIQLQSINPNTLLFDLAVLATYGNNKSKSIDDLVSDLERGVIPKSKKEEIALLFGLNNGYSKFRNKYKYLGIEKPVKFELNSKLDYYIVESIHQYVFNNNKENYSFPYIDDWVPELKEDINKKGFETYKILDTVVINKKKQEFLSQGHLEDLLQKISTKAIYTAPLKEFQKLLLPFLKFESIEGEKYFEGILKEPVSDFLNSLFIKLKIDHEVIVDRERKKITAQEDKEKALLKEEIINLKQKVENLENKESATNNQTVDNELYQSNKLETTVEESKDTYRQELSKLSLKDLKEMAKKRKIPFSRYTEKDREKLIDLILNKPQLL